jgi:hypothetical protein
MPGFLFLARLENFRAFPRKRESDNKFWVAAFRLRAPRFAGLKPAEARKASGGWVAGTSGRWMLGIRQA